MLAILILSFLLNYNTKIYLNLGQTMPSYYQLSIWRVQGIIPSRQARPKRQTPFPKTGYVCQSGATRVRLLPHAAHACPQHSIPKNGPGKLSKECLSLWKEAVVLMKTSDHTGSKRWANHLRSVPKSHPKAWCLHTLQS